MNCLFQPFCVVGWVLAGIVLGLSFSVFLCIARNPGVQRCFKTFLFLITAAWLFTAFFYRDPEQKTAEVPFSPVSMVPSNTDGSFHNASDSKTVPLTPLPEDKTNSAFAPSYRSGGNGTAQQNGSNGSVKTAEYRGNPGFAESNASSVSYQTNITSQPPQVSLDARISKKEQSGERSADAVRLSALLQKARSAAVQIEAKIIKPGSRGNHEVIETGSGVIVKMNDRVNGDRYCVLTNHHVAGNPVSNEDVKIILNGNLTICPEKVFSAGKFDLAVLLLNSKEINYYIDKKVCSAAVIGNSDDLLISQTVWAIGAPYGLSGTVTKGIISNLNLNDIPLGIEDQVQGFIQTDASINPGNSGGPLVNEQGEVVGIVTAIASKKGENSGVSFAIPINNAVKVAEQLVSYGAVKRPYVGVSLDRHFEPSEKCAKNLMFKPSGSSENSSVICGARVSRVIEKSPADQAGMRDGDIILSFNGELVKDEEHFEDLVSLSKVNLASDVEVMRGEKVLKMEMTPIEKTE